MVPNIYTFTLPKIGEAQSSNQDRFDQSQTENADLIALADGAGASLYPGQWAERLVKAFCQSSENPIPALQESYSDWLAAPQAQWRQYYLERLKSPSRKWWQGGSEQKACGFSTFIGLRLERLIPESQLKSRWQAVAVGDSCLFQWAASTQQLITFPCKTAQSFRTTTQCFASLPEYPSCAPTFTEGDYQLGDLFLLATDALSRRLLCEYEQENAAWKQWFRIKTYQDFSESVAELRQKQLIQNDDTTMVLFDGAGVNSYAVS
jgi:hypothetical protein